MMKAVFICVIIAVICFAIPSWEAIGPYSASSYVLDVAPSDNDIIYVAGQAGNWRPPFYKSTDGGETWSHTGTISDMVFEVYALAIHPTDPNIIYTCVLPQFVGYPWIYRSTDGGTTWEGIDVEEEKALGPYLLYNITIHSTTHSTIYTVGSLRRVVGTDTSHVAGYFKSTDAGSTWTDTIIEPDSVDRGNGRCMTIDPANANTMYVGGGHTVNGSTRSFVYKSTDGGITYVEKSSGLPQSSVYSIVIHPSHSDTVYAGTDNGVYRSIDGAETWSAVLSEDRTRCVTVSSDNPNIVYALQVADRDVRHDIVYKSTDAGASWSQTGSGILGSGNTYFMYYNVMKARQDNANTVYVSTYTGFYKTANGGTNWYESIEGMDSPGWITAMGVAPSTSTTLYTSGGDYASDCRSDNSGTDWTRLISGSYVGFGAIAVHTTNPDTVIASTGWS